MKNGFKNKKEYIAALDAVKSTISVYYQNLEFFQVRFERGGICVYLDDFFVELDPDGGHIVEYKPQGKPIIMGSDIFGAVSVLCFGAKQIYKDFWEVSEQGEIGLFV